MNFDECTLRLQELYNKIFQSENWHENYNNENYKTLKVEFNEVFLNLLNASVNEKECFSGSPLNLFKIEYEKFLKIEETKKIDFDENECIKSAFLYFCRLLSPNRNEIRKGDYYYISQLNDENYKLFCSILKKRIEYLEKLLFTKGIEVITHRPYPNDYRINYEFKKHINIMVENDNLQPLKPALENTLKWNGTQTEFIELVKALIENGNIKGTQTEIISKLSNVFNLEIKNPNKLINDLKLRNNNSETLFLGRLQKTLFDYITLEKKK
jgi:hypothetical protein